jgi:hypothetical protein
LGTGVLVLPELLQSLSHAVPTVSHLARADHDEQDDGDDDQMTGGEHALEHSLTV